MWRKAFLAVLCWLTLSQTSGEAVKTVNSSVVKDNVSADSAPRLYRNVPLGVYASAAPYAAYSFHLPAFAAAPKALTSASRVVPVINNANGYLRDSYGNRFVDTPQSAAYKTAFPQQFLPLQELPAHLSQPLVAASSQTKHPSPHYFLGSQYRGPTFQVAQHPSAQSFAGFSQPFVYGRNYAPFTAVSHTQAITAQQQPNSNKVVYSNTQSVHPFSNQKGEVKFQRLEHRPANNNEAHHSGSTQAQENKAQIQAAPATIKAVVNGKETLVHVDTDPPVPLLDLSLLEPLTFENPLVPQVQHFLPRINAATYHKLPEFNVNESKKTSGNVKGKSSPKKKSKQPTLELDEHDRPLPVNPTITVKTTQNESPEIVYEINKPNYKETYKEKSVSYNKEADSEPVIYSYDEKTQSEPIEYSYSKTEQKKPVSYNIVHETNGPVKIQHSSYGSNEQPKQLIYSFKPEEQSSKQNDHPAESEDSGSAEDSSEESDNDRQSHPQSSHPDHAQRYSPQGHTHEQSYPRSPNHHSQSHRPQSHHQQSHHQQSHHPQSHHPQSHHPQSHRHHSHSSHEDHSDEPRQNYDHSPKGQYHPSHQTHAHNHRGHDDRSGEEVEHRSNDHRQHNENHGPNEKITHRSNENVHHNSGEQEQHKHNYAPPHQRSQDIKVPVQPVETQYPVTQEFEEEIRIEPSEAPARELTDNSEKKEKEEQSFEFHPLSSLDQYQKFVEQQKRLQKSTVPPQTHSAAPVIHEQAKRIIIQEESPEEMHTHQEQNIMAEMIQDDGNDEEDFEKAYKNAALGFNAYGGRSEKQEKDVYSPESYGLPREYTDFDIEKTPFEQYQAEGDKFPKSARANYKDSRDHTKEDYYLDYAVHKPGSMAELYQNKANYYKLYKKQSPQKYFADEHDSRKKERKSEKYTIAPSYDFGPAPKRKQNYFAQYKAEPVKYEYKFGKDSARDNTAHASRPYQRYKSKTYFVEPQFQYGFEPIAVPRLLDSELAAMASNHSPESEKPGMRKKIYKENWYIKKTSTSGGKPS